MKNDKMKNQYRVNEQIRARDVRVVSDGGAEVMPTPMPYVLASLLLRPHLLFSLHVRVSVRLRGTDFSFCHFSLTIRYILFCLFD